MAKFDPDQPFDEVKFDPEQPFEADESNEPPASIKLDSPEALPEHEPTQAKAAMAKLKSGERLGPEDVALLKRYLAAGDTPKRYDEAIAEKIGLDPKQVRGANAVALDAATLGMMTGNIGEAMNKAGSDSMLADASEFRDAHPVKAALASAAGAAPLSMAMPNTLLANAGVGALSGLGGSRAKDLGDLSKDAAAGAGFGALGHLLGLGVGKGVQYGAGKAAEFGGKAVQLGQRGYEAALEALGKGSNEALTAAASPSSGSALQMSLKDAIAAGEAAARGPVSQAADLGVEASKVSPEVQAAALERLIARDAAAANVRQPARAVAAEPVIPSSVDDMAATNAGAMDLDKTAVATRRPWNGPESRNDEGLVSPMNPRQKANRYGADADRHERYNQMWRAGEQDPERAISQIANDMNGYDRARGRQGWDLDSQVSPAKAVDPVAPTSTEVFGQDSQRAVRQELRGDFHNSPAGQSYVRDIMSEVNDQVTARGIDPSSAGTSPASLGVSKQATQPWLSTEEISAAEMAATKAQERMRNINAGKKRYDQVMMASAAASQLPVVGSIPGAAGAAMGTLRAVGSDSVAGAGRMLEGFGKRITTPESLTSSWLANPNIIGRMAQRPDKLGRGAKFVMEGMQEAGEEGMKARLFVLSMQPWFREMMASENASEGTSPPQ